MENSSPSSNSTSSQVSQSVNVSTGPHSKTRFISLLLLVLILAAMPVTVVILARNTRLAVQAETACKRPDLPDPADCVGGEWKLSKNTDNCLKFRCELR